MSCSWNVVIWGRSVSSPYKGGRPFCQRSSSCHVGENSLQQTVRKLATTLCPIAPRNGALSRAIDHDDTSGPTATREHELDWDGPGVAPYILPLTGQTKNESPIVIRTCAPSVN
jgi:hypothetical protein